MPDQDETATPIKEKTNFWVKRVLKDSDGIVIPASALTELKLTYYDVVTPATIINSRDHQDVLHTNNVTLDSSGNLVWSGQVADSTLLSQSNAVEYREALFEWTGPSVGTGKWVIRLAIMNLTQVV